MKDTIKSYAKAFGTVLNDNDLNLYTRNLKNFTASQVFNALSEFDKEQSSERYKKFPTPYQLYDKCAKMSGMEVRSNTINNKKYHVVEYRYHEIGDDDIIRTYLIKSKFYINSGNEEIISKKEIYSMPFTEYVAKCAKIMAKSIDN